MKRKKVIIFCILSTCILLSIPHIPAITYNETKDKIYAIIEDEFIIENNDQQSKNLFQNQKVSIQDYIETCFTQIESKANIFSLFRIIINFILTIIVLILNILITFISLGSGLINALFSTALTIFIGIIKQILNLSDLLEKFLDVISSIASGLFGIFLNIVVGILTLIKNVIVDIISPNMI